MPSVDLWMIYDNSRNPRTLVAKGGRQTNIEFVLETTYNKIKSYV